LVTFTGNRAMSLDEFLPVTGVTMLTCTR